MKFLKIKIFLVALIVGSFVYTGLFAHADTVGTTYCQYVGTLPVGILTTPIPYDYTSSGFGPAVINSVTDIASQPTGGAQGLQETCDHDFYNSSPPAVLGVLPGHTGVNLHLPFGFGSPIGYLLISDSQGSTFYSDSIGGYDFNLDQSDIGTTLPSGDGLYYFQYSVEDSSDIFPALPFYVYNGLFYLSDPFSSSANSTSSPLYVQDDGNISFGIAVIIFLLTFCLFAPILFNIFSHKNK